MFRFSFRDGKPDRSLARQYNIAFLGFQRNYQSIDGRLDEMPFSLLVSYFKDWEANFTFLLWILHIYICVEVCSAFFMISFQILEYE